MKTTTENKTREDLALQKQQDGAMRSIPAEDMGPVACLAASIQASGLSSDRATQFAQMLYDNLLANADVGLADVGKARTAEHVAADLSWILEKLAAALEGATSRIELVGALDAALGELDVVRDQAFSDLFAELETTETGLRCLNAFFENAEKDELPERASALVFDQVLEDTDQLYDLEALIKPDNKAFQLSRNRGLLVIPGYHELFMRQAVERLADRQGLLFISDAEDCHTLDALLSRLEQMDQSGNALIRNVKEAATSVVVTPWVQARTAHWFEADGMWLPPSSALAGVISRADRRSRLGLAQGATNEKNGQLIGVRSARFDLDTDDVKKLTHFQLNPVYFGVNSAYVVTSSNTLADDDHLYQFQVRRTFDYIAKRVANVGWKLQGQLLTTSVVMREFYEPVRTMLNEMKREGLVLDYEVSIEYSAELFSRGILRVTLRVRPTAVADLIEIKLDKYLSQIEFESV